MCSMLAQSCLHYILPYHTITEWVVLHLLDTVRPSGFRFEPFNVIEAEMEQPANKSSSGWDPAGQATAAFRALAGFLFGKNKQEQKFGMTMPVITDTTGRMRFIMPSSVSVRLLCA